jgi:hypothetical protein
MLPLSGGITPRITGEQSRLNLRDSLAASPVEPLVRPPNSDAVSFPSFTASPSGDLTLAITGEPARLMITGTLYASPVERLVRPPMSEAVNIPSFVASRSGGSNARHQRARGPFAGA